MSCAKKAGTIWQSKRAAVAAARSVAAKQYGLLGGHAELPTRIHVGNEKQSAASQIIASKIRRLDCSIVFSIATLNKAYRF